jgi:hypothetical protein
VFHQTPAFFKAALIKAALMPVAGPSWKHVMAPNMNRFDDPSVSTRTDGKI